MTEKLELYRCNVCGNMVQIILSGSGELVCCGQLMELMKANTSEDGAVEKHIPIYAHLDNGDEIIVGSIPHPMTNEHYIMFIESISSDKNRAALQYLHPGEEPKMFLGENNGKETALEYCNIHGLWEGKSDK